MFCFALFLTREQNDRERGKSAKPQELLKQISHCNLKNLRGMSLMEIFILCMVHTRLHYLHLMSEDQENVFGYCSPEDLCRQ